MYQENREEEQMSQSDQFDNWNSSENSGEKSTTFDTYAAESSADLYRTPDLSRSLTEDAVEEPTPVEESEQAAEPEAAAQNAPYGNSSYGGNPSNGQPTQSSNAYDNHPYGTSPYNGQPAQDNGTYNNNLYGNSPYSGSPYNSQPVQSNNPYGNNPYGNISYSGQPAQNDNPYNNSPYGGGFYGSNPYNGQNTQYNNNPYGNPTYGGPYSGQTAQRGAPYNNGPYGSGSYNRQNTQNNPYGNPPYVNNQYSPYAVPPKNHTGLIIGIVIGIIVLFLIAVFALAYKAVTLYTEDNNKKRSTREEYNFDDDDQDARGRARYNDDYFDDYDYHDDDYDYYGYPYDYDYDYDYDYPYGNDYPYDNDDYFDDDHDYDSDEYYTLHNDIKDNLSYSVKMEEYEYDTTYENVYILVDYPVIEGKDVPNLEKLNSTIKEEIDFITEYFEEEYQEYYNDSSDYFYAQSTGYVTYMDEEKLSIAFSEYIYSGYYNDVYLYGINIDLENGIVLENENILSIDDDFSVDFRRRSDIQNDEISYLTVMSDQEITKYFNSSDIIVFYTPQGMEIGFNYDEGWVTVTYKDYEKYLKVF